jgi:D-tyrosyl-tRNA(Tyr) deacylase
VVQRVAHASVVVDGEEVGCCGMGLLVLLAVAPADTPPDAQWLAKKIASLRIFPDENHHMNRGMTDVQGEALVISQFTLYGDCRKGRRPSFIHSAPPDHAEPLYLHFCDALAAEGVPTSRGVFGADMKVSLLNDGPVTLVVDTPPVRS